MSVRKFLATWGAAAAVATVAAAGVFTHDTWRAWLFPASADAETEEDSHAHEEPERVRLSPQARANLRLVVQPLQRGTYWRTIQVPGMVVERPGTSDHGITAPVAGIIQRITAVPGDAVRPGDELFTLRLASDVLRDSQAELFKTSRELQINREQRERLAGLSKTGAIPETRLLELDFQQRRLSVTLDTLRHGLRARGLTEEQVREVEEGRFLTELIIRVPRQEAVSRLTTRRAPEASGPETHSHSHLAEPGEHEVEDLKVHLGEQVQAGQVLCSLAHHQSLYLQGRAFEAEGPLVARAAQEHWPVATQFPEESAGDWPPFRRELTIQYLANTVDPASQTFAFYVPLANESREYQNQGKTYRIWRFRPGQRVRLAVPVEQFQGVFVLPAEAVVREGAEAYVFRQNGDAFDRRPVHVLHDDRRAVVVANDGSINEGNAIAHNAAAGLNRILKAQASEGEGHGHGHHHHDH
jgi:biotin carboxyl carrier protein